MNPRNKSEKDKTHEDLETGKRPEDTSGRQQPYEEGGSSGRQAGNPQLPSEGNEETDEELDEDLQEENEIRSDEFRRRAHEQDAGDPGEEDVQEKEQSGYRPEDENRDQRRKAG